MNQIDVNLIAMQAMKEEKMKMMKNKLVITLLFVVVGFGALWVYLRVGKQTQLPPSLPPSEVVQSRFGQTDVTSQIMVTAQPLDLPSELQVFKASSADLNEFGQRLALAMDLAGDYVREGFWADENGRYVSVIEQFNKVDYVGVVNTQTLPVGINIDQAVGVAEVLLKSMQIGDFVLDRENVEFFVNQGDEPALSNDPSRATIVALPYTYAIKDKPIKIEDQPIKLMTIWVASDLQITKAILYPSLAIDEAPVEVIVPMRFEDLAIMVSQGKGIVTSIRLMNRPLPIGINELSQIVLDRVNLEYRYTSDTGLVYPYLHFSGTGSSSKGQAVVEIIIPVTGVVTGNN